MSYTLPTPAAPGSSSAAPLVPFACYTCIALKVTPGIGKRAPFNPNVCVEVQILAPDVVRNSNGSESKPAGVKGDMYIAFSEKNMKNCIDALSKLGITFPAEAATFEEACKALQAAVAAQLPMRVFDMTVSSKREPMIQFTVDENGQQVEKPMTDSRNQPIQGQEKPDFAMFNIVGNPRSVEEAGVSLANPY